jgi:hypothetical protein
MTPAIRLILHLRLTDPGLIPELNPTPLSAETSFLICSIGKGSANEKRRQEFFEYPLAGSRTGEQGRTQAAQFAKPTNLAKAAFHKW